MNSAPVFLPYGRQLIDDDDVAAVSRVLRGDYLTTGPTVAAFEAALAAELDAPFAVACSSATAGLHLAAMALGIGPGERVVVPAVTFLATANAACYVGAEVIFADVDPNTGLSGPSHFADAIARAGGPVKALMPVHLAGQAHGPAEIRELAACHDAFVIEDACHAIGASYKRNGIDAKVGACLDSDAAVFSFHPVKTIAMGEGGAVTTRDEKVAERLLRFRSHGMIRDASRFEQAELAFDANGQANPWYYEMPEPGFNYRASDIHCALGLSQLTKLKRFVRRRNEIADQYDKLLAPFAPTLRPLARTGGMSPAWHLYVVMIDFNAIGRSRADVMRRLHGAGVGTQVHYIPLPLQPYYRDKSQATHFPGSLAYYERCLSLPMFASMTPADVERVVSELRKAIA